VESAPCDSTILVETSRDVVTLPPISLDLRLRIVRAVERGSSIRAAARRFAVSPSAAIKLTQRVRTTGSAAPARYGGHWRPLLEAYEADLKQLVEATPDMTLAELQTALQRRCGVVAGLTTLHNTLRRIGLRHKKRPVRAAEQDRPDVAGKRRLWRAWSSPCRQVNAPTTPTTAAMVPSHHESALVSAVCV
jgi:transposase